MCANKHSCVSACIHDSSLHAFMIYIQCSSLQGGGKAAVAGVGEADCEIALHESRFHQDAGVSQCSCALAGTGSLSALYTHCHTCAVGQHSQEAVQLSSGRDCEVVRRTTHKCTGAQVSAIRLCKLKCDKTSHSIILVVL